MIDDTFINEFKIFRHSFENKIKENKITYCNDWYLIENEWYNELEKNIEIYEDNKRNKDKSKVFFPKKSPVFINNINKAIDYLKSNNKPQLINSKLMNKIYKNENLKNNNVIKYYSGYNNLIIMFMEKEFNNGLLLFSLLDNNNKNDIIFSFKINNKKFDNNTHFYSELIKMKKEINKTLVDNLIKRKIINYYTIIKKNNEILKEILKIFISIFYYEKSLSSNINEIFSNSQNFNLINPEWFNEFKDYYNYEIMNDILNEYEIEKKGFNYSNLDKYINEILIYVKDQIKPDKIELPDELIDYSLINPPIITKNSKEYKCHLIPFSLMNLIKENTFNNKNISIKPNMVFAKNNNIYIVDSYKIIFGNINEELIFNSKYIFSYDSKDILEKEKDEIYSTSIKKYIQQRKCNLNDSNIQKLKENNSKELGDFIILNNNNSKTKNNNYIEKSDSPLIKKNVHMKTIGNNNKYDIRNQISSKLARFHSKFLNNKNYNLSEEEIDEKEQNKDISEKEYDKLNLKNINNNIKNLNDRLNKNKTQQNIADEYDLEVQKNLNNESFLEDLQEKINELDKDNKKKEIEIYKTIKILNEKDIIIQKMNEDMNYIKNELESLKINNNDIIEEKEILLNNLEKNKKEIQKKEEEKTNLKFINKNEKDKYEKLIEEKNNILKEKNKLLEEKENELLKYKTNIKKYEDNEIKLKELEDIEKLIENKNKEMKEAINQFNEKTKDNNDLIKKKEELEKEIKKNQKEYEQILKLIEDKKKEKEDINAKYEELKKSFNQLKSKEEELKKKEVEIQKKEEEIKSKENEWKNFEKEQNYKIEEMKKKEVELENKEKEMKKKEEELKKREEEINNKEKLP